MHAIVKRGVLFKLPIAFAVALLQISKQDVVRERLFKI